MRPKAARRSPSRSRGGATTRPTSRARAPRRCTSRSKCRQAPKALARQQRSPTEWSSTGRRCATHKATTRCSTSAKIRASHRCAIGEAPGGDGTWDAGENVEVAVTFEEPVVVDTEEGTPTLRATVGGSAYAIAYATGTGTDTLTFAITREDEAAPAPTVIVEGDSLALNEGPSRAPADSRWTSPTPGLRAQGSPQTRPCASRRATPCWRLCESAVIRRTALVN